MLQGPYTADMAHWVPASVWCLSACGLLPLCRTLCRAASDTARDSAAKLGYIQHRFLPKGP